MRGGDAPACRSRTTTMALMPGQRLYTAEDLLAAGGPGERCELWDGVMVVREPSELGSDAVAHEVGRLLSNHARARRLGVVPSSNTGFVVARRPDRVLSPDSGFIRRERLAGADFARFVEGAPDLAVEVRSHTERWPDVLEKCGVWIAHGARLVWAIEPRERLVEVFEPGKPSRELRPGDLLDGAPVLPDFRVPVAELFDLGI